MKNLFYKARPCKIDLTESANPLIPAGLRPQKILSIKEREGKKTSLLLYEVILSRSGAWDEHLALTRLLVGETRFREYNGI